MNQLTQRYLQGGCLSSSDKLLSVIHSDLPYYFNAAKASARFREQKKTEASGNTVNISIPNYQGSDKTILKIRNYIEENMSADVVSAILHGSTGTNELIGYSDFDGILILKDECLSDINRIKRSALEIQDTYGMMLELDPLQHHGWQLFSESDLLQFDDALFPIELFRNATTLFGKTEIQITTDPAVSDYSKPFVSLCNIILKHTADKCPVTLFEVKILLSEFMLLPAVFIQAKEKKGIFKRESFNAAAKYFTTEEWQVMDDVSALRLNWNYHLHQRSERIAWKYRRTPLIAQIFHGNTPVTLRNKLENELMQKMQRLVRLMMEKISV